MIEGGREDAGAAEDGADWVAETTCAAGPVFQSRVRHDGTWITFCDAYPNAPHWLKRVAAWIERN